MYDNMECFNLFQIKLLALATVQGFSIKTMHFSIRFEEDFNEICSKIVATSICNLKISHAQHPIVLYFQYKV